MSRPVVFIDTETTCLGHLARPWEIAVVRREVPPLSPMAPPAVGWSDRESVLHVEYEFHNLPAGTSPTALQIGGWLTRGAPGSTYLDELPGEVYALSASEAEITHALAELLEDEPILVGVGVHFDAALLSAMFLRHGLPEQPWHYAVVDLKAATWGAVRDALACPAGRDPGIEQRMRAAASLPMSSERLSEALQVELPDDDERHTALGDARWARRWFDALTGVGE